MLAGTHLLLWVRVIRIVWDHFYDGAPCWVTGMQTIVHRPPWPLCHGRVSGHHGSSIHGHGHPLDKPCVIGRSVKEEKKPNDIVHRLRQPVALPHLGEVHVAVGQVLRLVVVVGGVCDARVVLLHRLVLGEGRLLGLQLGVHHVAAHQRLGPTRHGFCATEKKDDESVRAEN